jgi:hypothetical protein
MLAVHRVLLVFAEDLLDPLFQAVEVPVALILVDRTRQGIDLRRYSG